MGKKVRPELTKEDKKKANRLCLISLLLGLVVPLIFGAASYFLNDNGEEVISTFLLFPAGASLLAGAVLMIIVRAKYSRSIFGKILMILYILLFAIGVIGVVYLILTILSVCTDPTW